MNAFYSKTLLALSAGALLPLGQLHAAKNAKNPNIIFILADDMGIGDISAFNENSKIHTSNLDKLSENGIRFTDAHSNSAVSTPSRYGILTGRYSFRTSLKTGTLVGFSDPLIDADRSTMGTMLRKQGYNTACIGKWHLGWNWAHGADKEVDYSKPITNGPTTRGFDYFFGISASLDMSPYVYVENDRITAQPDRITPDFGGLLLQRKGPAGADFDHKDVLPNIWRRSVKYIKEQEDSKKPFFLYVPLTAPHTPILPTEEYQGKSKLSPYADFVLMIDDMVGDIVKTLKETGQLDNTIVIFTTDNGCAPYADTKNLEKQGHFASYIYRGYKSDIYDGGHRIPLIISWGDRYKNKVENNLTSLTDFYATFAEMTGYKVPDNEGEDSYSMMPILSGKGKYARKDVVHHSLDGFFAIRSGNWKLVFCPGSGGWSDPNRSTKGYDLLPTVQLFDMSLDPSEQTNVQAEHPEVVAELTARMRQYLEDGRSTPGAKQSNAKMNRPWTQVDPFTK